MDNLRSWIAYLLFVNGGLHVVAALFMPADLTGLVTLAFGLAYIVIGRSLLQGGMLVFRVTLGVVSLGLVIAFIGMFPRPTVQGGMFILLDLITLACGINFLLKMRHRIAH